MRHHHVTDGEQERIRRVYATYGADPREIAKRDARNLGLRAIVEERRSALLEFLAADELLPLTGKRILDIGCGNGDELAWLCEQSADPALCLGVDLLADRIEQARAAHPEIRFACADARALEAEDGSFDLVVANVVFSSILDWEVATALALEMRRVLAGSGALVWYDSRYPNPWNPNVRRYRLRELEQLFPGFRGRRRSLTLVPQLARGLAPHSTRLVRLLSAVPLLRTRNLVLLGPQPPEIGTSGIIWSRKRSIVGLRVVARIRRLLRMRVVFGASMFVRVATARSCAVTAESQSRCCLARPAAETG